MTIPVIIDCDPGHDDAAAILYAASHLHLLGITTVYGNNILEATTRNALKILSLAGLTVPVYKGAERPLLGNYIPPGDLHGKTGLDGAVLPETDAKADDMSAVDALIQVASQYRTKLTIIALGPLTNIAQAIQRDPGFTSCIKEITLMGGSTTVGNSTAVAEFNIYCDPEAADLVFRSGIPLKIVGLNVTRKVGVGREEIAALRACKTRPATIFADLFSFYRERTESIFGYTKASLHDPCAVVPLVDPTLIRYRKAAVSIELIGEHTRGMTVCDFRDVRIENLQSIVTSRPANAEVAVEAQGAKIVQSVFKAIATF